MQKGQKVEHRGGKRDGSGRKNLTVSASQLKEMREAAEKFGKEHGKSFWAVCLEWVFDQEVALNHRQAAWKMYADKMVVHVAEGGEADKSAGPAVYLPGQRPTLELVKSADSGTKAA
jgi:hypothetical protein